MTPRDATPARVAVACGGTGGHLFPGLAVGRALASLGAEAILLVSHKDVDRAAVEDIRDLRHAALPAVALQGRNHPAFLLGFWRSYREALRLFRTPDGRPDAVLSMGGFTAAPPVLAGRRLGIPSFLHESNAVPGRANRLVARACVRAFVGFAPAATRLAVRDVAVVGTPVRDVVAALRSRRDSRAARRDFGFPADAPVLLVTGGSQGARGLNRIVLAALPELARLEPRLHFIHLSGQPDLAEVRAAHAALWGRSSVHAFLPAMHRALEAADVAVSRAGASSLAELAAVRIPSILVPLPAAADDHQRRNAEEFARAGAALLAEQSTTGAAAFVASVRSLLGDADVRERMVRALAGLDRPDAAAGIATAILETLRQPFSKLARRRAAGPRFLPARETQ